MKYLYILFVVFCVSCTKDNKPADPKAELITSQYTNPVFEPILADPAVIKADDGWFYAYGTEDDWGDGKGNRVVPVIRSKNLVDWTYVRNAFSKKPNWKNNGGIWATDVVKIDGKYFMYYSYSIWNDPNPGIGVAVSSNPEGPYIDWGKMFLTSEIGVPNSIDPFYIEENGKKYLFWGSYNTSPSQGTYGIELKEDGKRVKDLDAKFKIVAGDFEGVMIHKKGKYYYFFGSKGGCCDGASSSYRVHIGRSEKLEGPYLDKDGKDLKERGNGTLFLSGVGNSKFAGPGHNARIITDDAGTDWFIYHGIIRTNDKVSSGATRRTLMLDKIVWENEWPTIKDNTPSIAMQDGPSFYADIK